MNLPLTNRLLLSLPVLFAALTGCANVSVSKSDVAYAPRGQGCAVAWQQGNYERYSAEYEYVGDVTLHNDRGLSMSDDKRELLEDKACELGGDTVLRSTDSLTTANLQGFNNQKFAVLRRRAPASSGDAVPSFDDAPAPSEGQDYAGTSGGTRGRAARAR